MTAGIEVEVKLAVTDPAALNDLMARPDPATLADFRPIDEPVRQEVVDRYFDTPDGRLMAAGARARLRVGAGAVVVAIKRHGVDDGAVTARHELEGPATADLDPSTWPDSPAYREIVELAAGRPLVEIARLRQDRLVRRVRRGPTEVELSLDALEALDGERVAATRWELEAELKAGDRADLQDLAAALHALPGTGPATGSKLSFALAARAAAGTVDPSSR